MQNEELQQGKQWLCEELGSQQKRKTVEAPKANAVVKQNC